MTAFDRAWDLVKMPYHGTTQDRISEIMEHGLKPTHSHRRKGDEWAQEMSNRFIRDPDTDYYGDLPRVYLTQFAENANDYARRAGNQQLKRKLRQESKEKTGHGIADIYFMREPFITDRINRPAIIRVSDQFPMRRNAMGLHTNETIPPKYLDVVYAPDIPIDEPLTYGGWEKATDEAFKEADLDPIHAPRNLISTVVED